MATQKLFGPDDLDRNFHKDTFLKLLLYYLSVFNITPKFFHADRNVAAGSQLS
jgi:hypothetical protein